MLIPDEWAETLENFQKKYPKVVLAGGALRDLDHGVKVKDLDFFVAAGSMDEAEGLRLLLGGKEVSDPESQLYPQSMNELVMVTETPTKVGGLEAQLIFCNWDVEDIWKRFDYGLCQIMYDGNSVRMSDSYKQDKDDKAFRLLRADTPYALSRSVERFARWKPKFPDHQWKLGVDLNLGLF